MNKSFKEIVEAAEFVFETHLVTTQDGYELKVFRIPGKKSEFPYHPTNSKNGFRKASGDYENLKESDIEISGAIGRSGEIHQNRA